MACVFFCKDPRGLREYFADGSGADLEVCRRCVSVCEIILAVSRKLGSVGICHS